MIDCFTDPILRGSTWGCIFMCMATSLLGVVVFLRKQSLLSETLSHAAFPGAALGLLFLAYFFPSLEHVSFIAVPVGALFTSYLGYRFLHFLEQKGRIPSDSALCFTLSFFFGLGIVFISFMQSKFPIWGKQMQMLLLGQAATMIDSHIWIYLSLVVIVVGFLFFTFRPLQAILFDPLFAQSARLPVSKIDRLFSLLFLLSLVVSIRSAGIVLITGMVIAPVVVARFFTNRLSLCFFFASTIGALSAFLGNYFSMMIGFPTGPMIVLVAALFAFLSLLFAPKKGLIFRIFRICSFKFKCLEENVLKTIWKKRNIFEHHAKTPYFHLILWRLKKSGWVDGGYNLTQEGEQKAASIVRLHRLWELYLTQSLGFEVEKVHRTAEEMEHILTPEMEAKLTKLLDNPTVDPHLQPIPEKRFSRTPL